RAKESFARGAESIRFTIDDKETDVKKLLDGVDISGKRVYFTCGFLCESFAGKINEAVAGRNAEVFILTDPVGHLAKTGNWHQGPDNFEALARINKLENCQSISADGSLYQNAGANIVQQIAYILCHAAEYLN